MQPQHIYLKSGIYKPLGSGKDFKGECVWLAKVRGSWFPCSGTVHHFPCGRSLSQEHSTDYPRGEGISPSAVEGHCWRLRSLAQWDISRNPMLAGLVFISGKSLACNLLWGLCDTLVGLGSPRSGDTFRILLRKGSPSSWTEHQWMAIWRHQASTSSSRASQLLFPESFALCSLTPEIDFLTITFVILVR